MKKINSIGLIAPSGVIRNIDEINSKIKILEKNFKVKKFYDENISNDYLSDSDENRLKYLTEALLDPKIDLILPIRGGYGAIRIVDKIDYQRIKNVDKIFLGSSDISILLMALSKKTNIKCYHSLMISNGFVENLEKNIEIIENDIFDISLEPVIEGNCKGILWGGNLSTVVSLFSGELYLPDNDIILFLEDLNEPKYKIDKMLYEIRRSTELCSKIKGLILGDFYYDGHYEKKDIEYLLFDFAKSFNVPVFSTFDITHKKNNITIPYGKEVSI